ncbi:SMI1/KNR4 family protein [Neobacillus sp. PS3-34]|uniref:SMI1/KNR4 family protein n=1 Tax=Neobacillus sp. PS3-34 TaxID=3070678 RepID=UPI0027E0A9C1|nr:SMI1/KNR4 family protein [Neobacillus sp. PS3-34]WML48521.1 SMI1/KNR4 family protein [Neobacillus sp. PS3-34]
MFKEFEFNTSTSKQEIEKVEEVLNVNFPPDYIEFMLKTNGGEGTIGESYLKLWEIQELIESNEDYSVPEFAPGLLIIGSDGGGTAYGYDFRQERPKLVEVDFIGMDIENPNYSTDDFFEFMKYLYTY